MTQPPVEDMTARNHEAPTMRQFSVFLPNRVGKMLEMLDIFEDTRVKLEAISVVDSADFGVCRIVTNDADLTRKVLESHKVAFSESEIMVVEMAKHQRLSDICGMIRNMEVSIHHVYPLFSRPNHLPTVALAVDDLIFASQALQRKGIRVLAEEDFNQGTR